MSSLPLSKGFLDLEAIQKERAKRECLLYTLFPNEGPLRRELYPKHVEFFDAGKSYKERLFMAGNRIGKSFAGGLETACHLTGYYPAWWTGKRFDKPVTGWACGTSGAKTREINQTILLGDSNKRGMLPAELVFDRVASRGITGAYESIRVKHKKGLSRLDFKGYEQGRRAFEGTAQDFIWLDEEPDIDIYTECLYRLLTTKGIIFTTFTPLLGMSEVVTSFLEPASEESDRSKFVVQAGWKDVPHIDETEKKILIASTPLHQIQARTDGTPILGSGAIYPIGLEDITVDTFPIPPSWRRAYAMDVGWNRTACIWGAEDPGNGRIVLYDEYYQSMGEPASHAAGIRARGDWIMGVIDPAARGRSQKDGQQLIQNYKDLGLQVVGAINTVEAGLSEVWQGLVSGQLKAMRHLSNFFQEFKKYHRDEKGHVVKKYDHLMDTTRYLWMSGRQRMTLKPSKKNDGAYRPVGGSDGWMM